MTSQLKTPLLFSSNVIAIPLRQPIHRPTLTTSSGVPPSTSRPPLRRKPQGESRPSEKETNMYIYNVAQHDISAQCILNELSAQWQLQFLYRCAIILVTWSLQKQFFFFFCPVQFLSWKTRIFYSSADLSSPLLSSRCTRPCSPCGCILFSVLNFLSPSLSPHFCFFLFLLFF